MKRLIFACAAIAAGLCTYAAHAAPSECFTSPAAVFAAHPNATHASYTRRVKGSERCWYADAFRREPEAKPAQLRGTLAKSEPPPHTAAVALAPQSHTTAVVSAPQPRTAAVASAPQPRTTAVVSAPQPRTTAVASAPQPHTTAPAPQPRTAALAPARQPVAIEFLAQIAPWIQITPGLSRLQPVDESPTDFEGRFSAIRSEAQK